MTEQDKKRYTIREASAITGVPEYSLRQWEKKVPALRPGRTRARARMYTIEDINVIRELNHLVTGKKLPLEAAALELSRKLHLAGAPDDRQQAIALLDKIEAAARAMLRLLEPGRTRGADDY